METAPPELQLLIDAKSRFSGGGGGHANGSGFGGGSTSPGKQGGFLQIDKMTMSKKPISEAKRGKPKKNPPSSSPKFWEWMIICEKLQYWMYPTLPTDSLHLFF